MNKVNSKYLGNRFYETKRNREKKEKNEKFLNSREITNKSVITCENTLNQCFFNVLCIFLKYNTTLACFNTSFNIKLAKNETC